MFFFLDDYTYEEIWIGGNLIVHSDLLVGTVNSINLCDRLSKALLIDRPGHIPSAVISTVTSKFNFVKRTRFYVKPPED